MNWHGTADAASPLRYCRDVAQESERQYGAFRFALRGRLR
jgi:hypothetical protein